jgi:hypothetical protein
MIVGIRLLAPDRAPEDLLSTGTAFELYEGAQKVATGHVL